MSRTHGNRLQFRVRAGCASLLILAATQTARAQGLVPTVFPRRTTISVRAHGDVGWAGTQPNDTTNAHRRGAIIGAVSGAVVGGLGSAAFILNATAPHCVRNVSDFFGCPRHSRI